MNRSQELASALEGLTYETRQTIRSLLLTKIIDLIDQDQFDEALEQALSPYRSHQ